VSRAVRYGVVGGLMALLVGLGWAFNSELRQSRARKQHLARLPSFVARGLDGSSLRVPATTGRPVVIIYFEPDCDHCQRQASEVSRHADEFGRTQVFWLSKDSLPALRGFAQQYGLLRFPAMRVAQIRPAVAVTMHFFSVPDLRVYNADKQLVCRYKGETSAAALLKQLYGSL
jgi:thiol-disulfide isomerase/thioredoxin